MNNILIMLKDELTELKTKMNENLHLQYFYPDLLLLA